LELQLWSSAVGGIKIQLSLNNQGANENCVRRCTVAVASAVTHCYCCRGAVAVALALAGGQRQHLHFALLTERSLWYFNLLYTFTGRIFILIISFCAITQKLRMKTCNNYV